MLRKFVASPAGLSAVHRMKARVPLWQGPATGSDQPSSSVPRYRGQKHRALAASEALADQLSDSRR